MSSYLPDSQPTPPPELFGCWSGEERLLRLRGLPVWVNVWFHFFEGGEAVMSMRYRDQIPSRVHGRWWVERGHLVTRFGDSEIRSHFDVDGEVLRWAGETLLRLPDRTASLPFGIQLPYRLSVPELPVARA